MSNPDIRLPGEESFPIKAQCTVCHGDGWTVEVVTKTRLGVNPWDPDGDPIPEPYPEQEQVQCERCHARGYYFLPLGE